MNLKLLLAAAITTCIVTTATQAKADIYQTGKELISPSVIENFTVGIITSIVTAVVVWLWGKIRALQILNRKSAFFGISSKENCLVVMNHDSNPNHKNTMALGDVETLIEVTRLIDEIHGKLVIAHFESILERPGKTAEFCIGGPDSNQRTKVHLETFIQGIYFNAYIPNDPDNIAIVTKEDKYRYVKNQDEHAILARFYPESDSYPIILICGQTSKGNQGARGNASKFY
ncbi:hypothetical protein PN450_22855 [Dolichospermum lemmermannii CS-548]|uniref:hypothetical protein n=1 Tax=Dolichospermum lemmermannii TaxID=54295 RepID=UPI00232EEBED|nr:hypothetical protein [Dolichospermum lemmermannii]MDB9439564.1 hypothetical protein [Dolichospermum lemmermannii CS-548]